MVIKKYDELVEVNLNPNLPKIFDHLHSILIIGDSGLGKTSGLRFIFS